MEDQMEPRRKVKVVVGNFLMVLAADVGLATLGVWIIDLGVNVPPAEIVRRTVEESAVIVALSAVLTSAIMAMQKTIEAFEAEGLRDKIHIIIGGACASPEVARSIRADAYGRTPEDSARTCEKWLAEM